MISSLVIGMNKSSLGLNNERGGHTESKAAVAPELG